MLRSCAFSALRKQAAEVATHRPLVIAPDSHVLCALRKMVDNNVGALLVSPSERTSALSCLGIVTERDVLFKLDIGAQLDRVSVGDVMTPRHDIKMACASWSLQRCLEEMQRGNFRHLPVRTQGTGRVESIISMRDVGQSLVDGVCHDDVDPVAASASAAITVREMVHAHTRMRTGVTPSVVEVPKSSSVAEAVLQMREHDVGSVIVPVEGASIAESRHAFGIFTERDYIRLLSEQRDAGVDVRTARIADVMTDDVTTIEPEARAIDALGLMSSQGVRHLPVVTPARSLLAVLSSRDVMNHFLRPPFLRPPFPA